MLSMGSFRQQASLFWRWFSGWAKPQGMQLSRGLLPMLVISAQVLWPSPGGAAGPPSAPASGLQADEAKGQPAAGEAAPKLQAAAAPVSGRSSALLAEGADWPAGTIGSQLDQDTTLVPFGKGALFVPALTNPLDEPPVTVLQDGQRLAEGTTGHRIILSPGTYEVRVGSGAVQQRLRYQATIKEAHTTLIPVSWAGLSVHVVDEGYASLRTSYELIRVEDREYMGIGFGTDEQAGEPISTWVLRPGLYKIVRLGENYRARRDFATVRLVGGSHAHFLLVLNAETGEFAGGGEVPADELFQAGEGFFGSLVLGGDVAFNSRQGTATAGLADGLYFSFRAFLDSRLTLPIFDNPLLLRLQVEEGQSKGPGVPWQKSNDRIAFDALYIYRLKPQLGPYGRFSLNTSLLPGKLQVEEGDSIVVERQELVDLSEFQFSPFLGVTTIREGAGMNWRVFKSLFAETNVRAGVGARHGIVREGTFVEVPAMDDRDLPTFARLDSSNQVGVELTVLAVARLTRWVLLNLEVDSLFPFDSFDNTILEVEGSVALKLTSYMSVNYVLRFLRDPTLLESTNRLEQDVLLRFSLDIY